MSIWLAPVLSIVAAVSAVSGEGVRLDRGLLDGLRQGDVGNVFYVLKVAGRPVRIDAGTLEVVSCQDNTALGQPLGTFNIYAGFQVEFEIPTERLSPTELLRLANLRIAEQRWESSVHYLNKLAEMLPGDPLIEKRLEFVRSRLKPPTQTVSAPVQGEPGSAETPAPSPPAPTLTPPARSSDDTSGASEPEAPQPEVEAPTFRVPAGAYTIGVPRSRARFHNQYPEFEVTLPAFQIDVGPVSVEDYQKVTGRAPRDRVGDTATGVSYQEAVSFCRILGKRLPSEFEWEVAATKKGIEITPGTAEWTRSWYLPYPGNRVAEPEYGRRFRVIRGFPPQGPLDLKLRFFMAPEERAPDVGFRCAQDAN